MNANLSSGSSTADIFGKIRNSNQSFFKESVLRTGTIIALLILQSGSSMILEEYESIISRHVILILFLTMIVGAGGNAGCQAAVGLLQRISTDGIHRVKRHFLKLLIRESVTALIIATSVSVIAALRVMFSPSNAADPVGGRVIILSVFIIVFISVVLGFCLPLICAAFGLDPAVAGPTIQVIMDMLGVWISCALLHFFENNS